MIQESQTERLTETRHNGLASPESDHTLHTSPGPEDEGDAAPGPPSPQHHSILFI